MDKLISNIAYALDQAQGSVGGSELGCFVEELMKLMTRQQEKDFKAALFDRVGCGMKPFDL
jgi:hypothetical protein